MLSNECLRAYGLTAPHSCGWFYFQTTNKFVKEWLVFTVMTLLSKAVSEILWPGSIWQILQDIETEYQKGTRPSSSGASLSVPKPAILEGLQISLDIRTRRVSLVLLWDGLFHPMGIVRFILDRCYKLVLIFFVMTLFKVAWSITVDVFFVFVVDAVVCSDVKHQWEG